jgi:hypothetical protein
LIDVCFAMYKDGVFLLLCHVVAGCFNGDFLFSKPEKHLYFFLEFIKPL